MDFTISILPKAYFVILVLVDTLKIGIHVSRRKNENTLTTVIGMWPLLIYLLYLAVMTQFGIGAVTELLETAFTKQAVAVIAVVSLTAGYQFTKSLVKREYPGLFVLVKKGVGPSVQIIFHYTTYSMGAFLSYALTWFTIAMWYRIFQGGYPTY